MKYRWAVAFICALAWLSAAAAWADGPRGQTADAKRPITFDDLASMHRLSESQISPDGKWVAYTLATPDKPANRMLSQIWLAPVGGGQPRQLTRGQRDTRPRWSPDSKQIAFLSERDGAAQVYIIALSAGEARKLTNLSGGADNHLWSPDGLSIAFTSTVYPECKDDECNRKRDEEKEKSKVKARVYDHLLYRHWTSWDDGKRSHLFVISSEGKDLRDVTPGADYDVPPFSLGAPDAIAFSPDSKQLCFTANTDKHPEISTNDDLFLAPADGKAAPSRITQNPGSDWGPVYSPDGQWILYRAQYTPGYESDRWRLVLYQRATSRHFVMSDFDHNPDQYAWSADSKTIYFIAEDRAESPLFAIEAGPGTSPRVLIGDGFNAEFSVSADGKTLALVRTSLTLPAEVFAANSDGSSLRQVTHHNADLLGKLDLPAAEPFWFAGAAGTQVEGLLLRPPHFDPQQKYPLLLLIHGGPQGAWDDDWGYRWNPQLFAAPGYVVLMINPTGSTGYGHQFTDDINNDWGGKPYADLIKGADAAIAKYPFVDSARQGAAGASYGGYMIDWMATHTNRFKCLVSHAGVYDADSMYGATEELWFPEWDLRGTPWRNAGGYAKWSPDKFAAQLGVYKTPTLVTGGELDFRVPYTQDLEFFTALQRQGVPSKLVIFPDEGHWILKPQNSEFWYRTVLNWLATYLK